MSMNVPKSSNALVDTLANARDLLLNARDSRGAFCGELSSSALSTATASMALAMTSDPQVQDLARAGHAWLCEHQNVDGGWGDTVESPSNISTTLLAWSSLGFADREDAGARASLELIPLDCRAGMGRQLEASVGMPHLDEHLHLGLRGQRSKKHAYGRQCRLVAGEKERPNCRINLVSAPRTRDGSRLRPRPLVDGMMQ